MKATQVQPPSKEPLAKVCHTCGGQTPFPYAKEKDETYFCQRLCWEKWRADQGKIFPAFYVADHTR